jgi:hypothetical protein
MALLYVNKKWVQMFSSQAKQIIYLGRTRWRNTYFEQVIETMFVQRFSLRLELGLWNMHTNRLCLFSSLRDNSLVLFAQGWGWCTVNPKNLEHLG